MRFGAAPDYVINQCRKTPGGLEGVGEFIRDMDTGTFLDCPF